MDNKKCIICVGISASGKSTFAKQWVAEVYNRVEINRDIVRQQLVEEDGKEWCWDNWSFKRENEVNVIIDKQIKNVRAWQYDIIISDTNLTKKYRDVMIKMFEGIGYEVTLKDFPISYEEAVKRDNKRANGVGESVLMKQWTKWNDYIDRKKYSPNEKYLKCILVDIDGTLAHMKDRKAFDWNLVGNDTVDDAVKSIINNTPFIPKIIILSGRNEICRPETEKWLSDNDIHYDHLHMRKNKDMRDDRIIKEEIFWSEIANGYNVQFVIDDRPKVCRMWRDIGLKVFQVGNPHIEF